MTARLREAVAHWRALLAETPDFAEARRGLAEWVAEKTAVAVG